MRYAGIFTIVILFNIFAYALIKLRPIIYKNDLFKPMVWNMKLSITPIIVLFSGGLLTLIFLYLGVVIHPILSWIAAIFFTISILIWLLFLPNSAYLITELNLTHREMDKYEVPIWYDIISVLTLSLSGVFNTILGITSIQVFYLIYFDPMSLTTKNTLSMNLTAVFIIIIVSFGMYLGREIRFNSWDVLHPIKFLKRLLAHFKKENEIKNLILFTLLHSLFLIMMYIAFAPSFS